MPNEKFYIRDFDRRIHFSYGSDDCTLCGHSWFSYSKKIEVEAAIKMIGKRDFCSLCLAKAFKFVVTSNSPEQEVPARVLAAYFGLIPKKYENKASFGRLLKWGNKVHMISGYSLTYCGWHKVGLTANDGVSLKYFFDPGNYVDLCERCLASFIKSMRDVHGREIHLHSRIRWHALVHLALDKTSAVEKEGEYRIVHWKRLVNFPLYIRKLKDKECDELLRSKTFSGRSAFDTFVVSQCLENMEEVFRRVDKLKLSSKIAPSVLMDELYKICREVNPILTFTNSGVVKMIQSTNVEGDGFELDVKEKRRVSMTLTDKKTSRQGSLEIDFVRNKGNLWISDGDEETEMSLTKEEMGFVYTLLKEAKKRNFI